MSEAFKNIELIESYSEGKLSPQEKINFETRLINDKELKDEFDLYKKIVEGIKEAGEEKLKAKLRIADQELDSKNIVGKQNYSQSTKYWAIAASVFLVLGIFVLVNYFREPNLESLADKYYEKEKGLPVQMSSETNSLDAIMNSYKSSDYVATKNALHHALSRNLSNDTLNFYLGVTLYELGDYKGADECFVLIKENSTFYQKSQYRELLVFLKTKNNLMVDKLATEILSNKDHLYYDKVIQLRSELPN